MYVWRKTNLVLIKRDKVIARISEGDFIRFKLKDSDHFVKGFIQGVHGDFFRIEEDTIYVSKIAAVDLKHNPNSNFDLSDGGSKLIIAGLLLPIADLINSDDIGSGVAIVSGAFVVAGITLKLLKTNIFRVGRKKRILIGVF